MTFRPAAPVVSTKSGSTATSIRCWPSGWTCGGSATSRWSGFASAEDVYLFHGVARDNPKDHRLFAVAEVRDLTVGRTRTGRRPTRGSSGSACRPWPRCGRRWPGSPRDRPAPTGWSFTSDRRRIRRRAGRPGRVSAPLAEGAGLEKVVLRVASRTGRALREAVLHVEGIGGVGVTVHERPSGTSRCGR